MKPFNLQFLPPEVDLETPDILRACARAHRYLAELKGLLSTIPQPAILINTLGLQEAKDSSEIENIITTTDELFIEASFPEFVNNATAKEVSNYALALKHGFDLVSEKKILSTNHIKSIQEILEKNKTGFRTIPGTDLKNLQTGATVYVPPQANAEIIALMTNLEKYMNDSSMQNIDPLIKMAVIHFQFESIHPFLDGNGRTGRIINILYLVLNDLLTLPVLYLSRYIIQHKADYYNLLQAVRDDSHWEDWILYMLKAVEVTSQQTIQTVYAIKTAMQKLKIKIRDEHQFKFYSQDLINNLFKHPYTKIGFVEHDLNVTRLTASRYLDQLTEAGILTKEIVGRSNYYINNELFNILVQLPEVPES